MPTLTAVDSLDDALVSRRWDALVVVSPNTQFTDHPAIEAAVASARAIDERLGKEVVLLFAAELPGKRLVLAPTGPLTRDYDDVRRYGDAARAGLRRARDAGAKRPFVFVTRSPAHGLFKNTLEVALLEAIGGLWEPLEAREAHGSLEVEPVEEVGFLTPAGRDGPAIAERVSALEAGRRAARDITGTEPERMTPANAVAYAVDLFNGTDVRVEVIDDQKIIRSAYPLAAAVARASLAVERHQPRILRLVYDGPGTTARTYFFAGKGVVYDTGGADIKAGGHMAGMSRDKGGAAAVIGLFKTAARLKPRDIRMVAEIGFVRNSVGADAFVSDEIITAHSKCRVRIGNTDAEGRLVLADLLSHLREEAENAPDPILFSVATLTGHAGRAVGPYGLAVENEPARMKGVARRIAECGDVWGDPFEITRSRREDYDFIQPRTRADDVLSCNNAPSTATPRGHQFPMAFLAVASGLDRHGRDADRPLPYVHVDIGGSGVEDGDWQHGRPTATPVVALSAALGMIGES